jgi:Fe2+ or Zn2+ uptake regulation protein
VISNIKNAQMNNDIPPEINGLRMTKQRREIYRLLMDQRVHPTAQDVFVHVKDKLPQISLATVYNCLEALTQHSIIRAVHFDREPCRYCPNLKDHGHFHDQQSGKVIDITFKPGIQLNDFLEIPEGANITNIELTLRGTIAKQ